MQKSENNNGQRSDRGFAGMERQAQKTMAYYDSKTAQQQDLQKNAPSEEIREAKKSSKSSSRKRPFPGIDDLL